MADLIVPMTSCETRVCFLGCGPFLSRCAGHLCERARLALRAWRLSTDRKRRLLFLQALLCFRRSSSTSLSLHAFHEKRMSANQGMPHKTPAS